MSIDDEPGRLPLRERDSWWSRHTVSALLVVVLAALVALALPAAWVSRAPVYAAGTVADDDVIAPFTFAVPKSPDELDRERATAARVVEPVVVLKGGRADSVVGAVDALVDALDSTAAAGVRDGALPTALVSAALGQGIRLSISDASYLALPGQRASMLGAVRRVLDRALREGVAARTTVDGVNGAVRVVSDRGEEQLPVTALLTFDDVMARARRMHPDPGSPSGDAVFVRLLRSFFRPTLVLDSAQTSARRAAAQAAVPINRVSVRQGERIVRAHDVVDEETHVRLLELREAQRKRGSGASMVGRWIGTALAAMLVFALVGWLVRLQRPDLYGSHRAMAVLALALGLVIIASGVIARLPVNHPELVPVAFAAVSITLLAGVRVGVLGAMALAVVLGMQGEFQGTPTLAFAATGGIAAALATRSVRRRSDAYGAMLKVSLTYLVMAISVGLVREWTVGQILTVAAWGMMNGLLSVALAFTLLAPLEELSGVDTYLKLLEWSDLNRPLLRRLSLEAPGTFAHTIAVANLVEAACTAIGANGLLGRVGTYYHDIGKLSEPQFFVENQPRGRNPHDALAPAVSAGIIRQHVHDGLALADEHGLPRSIRAFIVEHHGTAPLTYFIEKARSASQEQPAIGPHSGEFIYGGPIPQSAETAICMLADGAEAVTRSLSDPTPARIRDVVEQIVAAKMGQGQLRDAPLSLRQLEEVKAQFVRVLTGMYHSRVEYPVPVAASLPARLIS
jgi:putative nucleotidyltransferase with HDIG domain